MSMRGVATGWAGSAAVLLVAAMSLSAARAEADAQPERKAPVPAVVVVAPVPAAGKAQPISNRAAKPPVAQPAWLKRLLSPSDLEPARKPS